MTEHATHPTITNQHLTGYFTPVTLTRARGIVQENLVAHCGYGTKPTDVFGFVWGTADEPYYVSITLASNRTSSSCTCPVRYQCKHAAATLLTLQQLQEQPSSQGNNPSSGSSSSSIETQTAAFKLNRLIADWTSDLVNTSLEHEDLEDQTGQTVFKWRLGQEQSGYWGIAAQQCTWTDTGNISKGKRYALGDRYDYYEYTYGADDLHIIDMLRLLMQRDKVSTAQQSKKLVRLYAKAGAHVLAQMLQTQRLFLMGNEIEPLSIGPSVSATLSWITVDGKNAGPLIPKALHSQRYKKVEIQLDGVQANHYLPTDPPFYIDVINHQIGPINTNLESNAFHLLATAPPIPEADAQRIANELEIELPFTDLPLPAESNIGFIDSPPVGVLSMHSRNNSVDVDTWQVTLQVRYDDLYLNLLIGSEPEPSVYTIDDGRMYAIHRDDGAEAALFSKWCQLQNDFIRYVGAFYDERNMDFVPISHLPQDQFASFERLLADRSKWEELGFEIIVNPPLNLQTSTASSFLAKLEPSENGWFNLSLTFTHAGHEYQLLPLVVQWLERGYSDRPLVFCGKDGDWLELPLSVLLPVAETMMELGDDTRKADSLQLHQARAMSLDHLQAEFDANGIETEWSDATGLLAIGEKLRALTADDSHHFHNAKIPRALKAELRPYQCYGMAWLDYLDNAGLNGILADDMGLGKTIQTLAHLQSLRQRRRLNKPVLIVVPTSLLGNWEQEAMRFTPSLPVRVWHGKDRHSTPLENETAKLIITSYALALRDNTLLQQHGFDYLILDEAQNIKNPTAKVTRALKALPIERRLCLSGTPIENHLGELWSQFDFLMPGLLGSKRQFTKHFRTPIEKHGMTSRQHKLNAAVQPFMLRRRKEHVATELPAKTEITQHIILEPKQAKLYEGIRLSMEKHVRTLLAEKGVARSQIQVLEALLKLRQACCHPALVKLPSARNISESAKTDHVMGMIQELIAEGRKIILFSQFTQMLKLLEIHLNELGINYVKLTGQTRKRTEAINSFQQGEVPIFLISLKAGGTGLNLTAADTVIHYDPWWNPAVERQATDRAHRIGQDKPVFVYKLIVKNTVEEKIITMQHRKQALSDATVEHDGASFVRAMSADDILNLFSVD